MREFAILKHIQAASSAMAGKVIIGPGDDMAMVKLHDRLLLAAVDQIVDGRHVKMQTTPLELVGRKAITRSLSDVAAMAGIPVASLAAAILPPDFGEQRANALFDAMRATAAEYDCPLIGGDIAIHGDPSHPMVCAVTVLAEPTGGRAIERRGAKAGDGVYVTGPLGGSLQSDGLGRHLTFEPRIQLGQEIARALGDRLHAMIDVSDGLGRDASHIAELSGVQLHLDAERIPCNGNCDWRSAMCDGEDYELCFAAEGTLPTSLMNRGVVRVGTVAAMKPEDHRLVVVRVGDRVINADEMGWQHES